MIAHEVRVAESAREAQAIAMPAPKYIMCGAAHGRRSVSDIVTAINRVWTVVRVELVKGLEKAHSLHYFSLVLD
jgi:hypothetical protein